jgi:hypothetical protein
MTGGEFEHLLEEGDPFDDPLWQAAAWAASEAAAGFGGLGPGWIGCSLAWLAWPMPRVETAKQLALALWVYRKCARARRQIVRLSNGELRFLGINRYAKYRILTRLQQKGLLAVQPQSPGRSVSVRLFGPEATCSQHAHTCRPP